MFSRLSTSLLLKVDSVTMATSAVSHWVALGRREHLRRGHTCILLHLYCYMANHDRLCIWQVVGEACNIVIFHKNKNLYLYSSQNGEIPNFNLISRICYGISKLLNLANSSKPKLIAYFTWSFFFFLNFMDWNYFKKLNQEVSFTELNFLGTWLILLALQILASLC